MDLDNILHSIKELSKEEVVEKRIELDDLVNIHPSLTLDNPLTYMVFISKRPDLSDVDKNKLFKIIHKLNKNRRMLYENTTKDMDQADYVSEPFGVESKEE